MSDDDGDDVTEAPEVDQNPGWVNVATALAQSLFTVTQLRALVGAGIIGTKKTKQGTLYNVADLARFEGMPRREEEDLNAVSPVLQEMRAMSEGWKSILELALRQTKQAQDHERQLITAFSKPLENLGESSKALVGAVLEQNKQLVQRANDGDAARLDFVKAAETMLRDQRVELREQAELDRKHQLRAEVWEGVKKAAPHLLEGLKKTTGVDRLEAATKLKEKLDPDKIASLVAFNLVDSEELELLCSVFGYDRADIERRVAEASAVKTADEEHDAAKAAAPEAAE
jgi:hypothetical protein